jgi:hypothetical protein
MRVSTTGFAGLFVAACCAGTPDTLTKSKKKPNKTERVFGTVLFMIIPFRLAAIHVMAVA